jgi:hypothetical protein
MTLMIAIGWRVDHWRGLSQWLAINYRLMAIDPWRAA